MATGVVVHLAGLTFNDGADGDGDEFWLSDIDGWDGASVEQVLVERPMSAGAVNVRGRQASRSLTITGWVVSGGSMGRARRKLEAALEALISADGTLEVEEDDATYALIVRLATQPRTRQFGPDAIRFDVDLVAANPAKTLIP